MGLPVVQQRRPRSQVEFASATSGARWMRGQSAAQLPGPTRPKNQQPRCWPGGEQEISLTVSVSNSCGREPCGLRGIRMRKLIMDNYNRRADGCFSD